MSLLFNQTNLAPGTAFATGGGGSNFPSGATLGVPNLGGSVFGVSSMVANYNTPTNPSWIPVRLNYNPATANLNDQVAMLITYNPDNAGQTAIALGAKGNGAAFVGSVWEGYITMPLEIWGATISLYSDNETFMYCDGKAGALGTVSTGVPFASSSNAFSSIVAPNGDLANMSALFSTFKSTYPTCFS